MRVRRGAVMCVPEPEVPSFKELFPNQGEEAVGGREV